LIFLTAFTKVKVVQAGQAGVTGLFVKPFDAKVIKRKLKTFGKIRVESAIAEAENTLDEGMRLIEENDYENALKLFLKLTQKGESAEAYYNIGRLHFDMTQIEEAKSYFEKALELDPHFKDAKAVLNAMEIGAF